MFRAALQGLIRVLFVVYCIEAGLFLVLAPWRDIWGTLLGYLPLPPLRAILSETAARGAISGFGLVHILWGVHDANEILKGRGRQRESRQPAPQTTSSVNDRDHALQSPPAGRSPGDRGHTNPARQAEGN